VESSRSVEHEGLCTKSPIAAINSMILKETKYRGVPPPPWIEKSTIEKRTWQNVRNNEKNSRNGWKDEMAGSLRNVTSQWATVLKSADVRDVSLLYCLYCASIAGSQMTLLPLLLTSPEGLAMSPTSVGSVYFGMSFVQVMTSALVGNLVDKAGKPPAMIVGCGLLCCTTFAIPHVIAIEKSSTMMMSVPFYAEVVYHPYLAGTLAVWVLGSSILSTSPIAFVSDALEDKERAQGLALLRTVGDVGLMVGALGVGALSNWTGNLDFGMFGCGGVLTSGAAWYVMRRGGLK